MTYVPVAKPRFTVDSSQSGEPIRIRPRWPIFPTIFLTFWLSAWTFGGVMAISQLLQQFSIFLALWLCGWLAGWIFAAASLFWIFFGAEILSVQGSDLLILHQTPVWSRRRLFEGTRIRHLKPSPQTPFAVRMNAFIGFGNSSSGSIQFDYGPRTVFAASGLDEAEARMIIDILKRRLPASAT